jgi:hypothetical protein
MFFQVIVFKELKYQNMQHDRSLNAITKVTLSKFFFSFRNDTIFSPIKTSSVVDVFIGGRYLLIIAHAIERYCSREGNEEFWMVFAKNLNCLIRAFTASTTHRTFVTHLD